MKHSMKMIWGCLALVVFVLILAATGFEIAVAFFVIPCMLMMGAMMWMMMRGMGGGPSGGAPK